MLGVVILTLTCVVGQVASMHPPAFTMNDGEDGVEIISIEKPVESRNLERVAAGELYQSDMLLTEEQWAVLRERKAIDYESLRWPEGADGYPLVPYVFQDAIDQNDIMAGINHWMEHTCIKFEETTNTDQSHLQFFIGSGCWSYVGMTYWHGQQVSIGSGCNGLGTVVHEVGHAIGFYHEQSRSDRDDYVVILEDNVEVNKTNNFDKHNDNNYSVVYDYSSNMHYGIDYFSENGYPTIITLDPLAQGLIGSRNGLTHRDKLLANRMYDCIGKWLTNCALSSDPCLNDGYTGADCTCICPPGTSGANCEVIDGDYYDHLRSPLDEKITTEKNITIVAHLSAGDRFTKWIVPPTCKKAVVHFVTEGNMFQGQCWAQYLYVRTDPSDYNGQILCYTDFNRYETSETEVVISMINYVNYGGENTFWTIDVKFEDIVGCSVPDATTQPPTSTPVNPTTTTPTYPPTTTEAPPRKIPCLKNPRKRIMKRGSAVTIASPGYPNQYPRIKFKCGWKLKAFGRARLEIECDEFQLHGRDVLKVNKGYFKRDVGPSTFMSKWLGITFLTKKRAYGPGFTCVVRAV